MEMILTILLLIALWIGSVLIAIIALAKVINLKGELREVQRQLIELMGQLPIAKSPHLSQNTEIQTSQEMPLVDDHPSSQAATGSYKLPSAGLSEHLPAAITHNPPLQNISPLDVAATSNEQTSHPAEPAQAEAIPVLPNSLPAGEPSLAASDHTEEPLPSSVKAEQSAPEDRSPIHQPAMEVSSELSDAKPSHKLDNELPAVTLTTLPEQPSLMPAGAPTSEGSSQEPAGSESSSSPHSDQAARQAEPEPRRDLQNSLHAASNQPSPSNTPPKEGLETWLGERGSAILGAVILGLAGLYFFKYSVEQGFITPALRLILAGTLGCATLIASHFLFKRGASLLANGLVGAGTTILFATVWAAHGLYQFLSATPAFILLGAITLLAGILAHRRQSAFIAVLSLAGGFSSPLMISVAEPSPIGLFGYLFLLNLGAIGLASRGRWPWLGFLTLSGTSAYQLLYFFKLPHLLTVYEALFIVLLFAGLFMLIPIIPKNRSADQGLRAGAQILAFFFTVIFANHSELALSLTQMVGVAALLTGASLWLSLRGKTTVFLDIAQTANALLLATFLFSRELTPTLSWAVVGFSFAVLLTSYFGYRSVAKAEGTSPKNILLGLFLFSVLLVFTPAFKGISHYLPWFLAWIMLTLTAFYIGIRDGLRFTMLLAGSLMGGAFLFNAHHLPEGLQLPLLWSAMIVWLCPWLLHRAYGTDLTKNMLRAGLMIGGFALQFVPFPLEAWEAQTFHHAGTHFAVVLMGLFVIGRGLQTLWLIPWVLMAFATQMVLLFNDSYYSKGLPETLFLCFGFSFLFLGFPIIKSSITRQVTPWISAGTAMALWLFPTLFISSKHLGPSWDFLTPLVLCAATFGAAWIVYRRQQSDDIPNKHLLTLLGTYVVILLTLTLCLWVPLPWLSTALAGEALLAIILWRAWNHAGLKYLGAGLIFIPFLLIWQVSESSPLWEFSLLYLGYFLAVISSVIILRNTESTRLRPWEKLLAAISPPVTHWFGTLAILVSFYWLNAAIHYYLVDYLPASLTEHFPARDLALSLGWVGYALTLIGLGFRLPKAVLRQCGLGFLILAIFKVFLYDLSELEDLYRVGSLLALALSLLSVSLLYRKFSKTSKLIN